MAPFGVYSYLYAWVYREYLLSDTGVNMFDVAVIKLAGQVWGGEGGGAGSAGGGGKGEGELAVQAGEGKGGGELAVRAGGEGGGGAGCDPCLPTPQCILSDSPPWTPHPDESPPSPQVPDSVPPMLLPSIPQGCAPLHSNCSTVGYPGECLPACLPACSGARHKCTS